MGVFLQILRAPPAPPAPPASPTPAFPPEAMASWQWNNFLEFQAPWNQKIVHMNLDETSCRLCTETNKGAVAVGQNRSRKSALQGEHRASLSARRAAVTLVATVCDDTEIQRELPQIVIGSEKVLLQTVCHTLNEDPVGRVYCLRQKTAWLNSRLLSSTIIKLIGKSLEKFRSTHYFILNMDACPMHCTQEVARACNRAKLRLCLVPASMTGVMQVCDTHVFSQLKAFIRQGMERLRLDSVTGEASTLRVMQLVAEAVEHVVRNKDWKNAFVENGFRDKQRGLGGTLRRKLDLAEAPQVSSDLPSLSQLQLIFPQRFIVPVVDLFRLCMTDAYDCVESLEPPVPPLVWAGRLRSTSALTRSARQDALPRETGGETDDAGTATITAESESSAQTFAGIPRARRLFPSTWRPPPPAAAQPPQAEQQ